MNVVDRMARLAMIAHNGVNRDGPCNVPYIVHPYAVVSMLKDGDIRKQMVLSRLSLREQAVDR